MHKKRTGAAMVRQWRWLLLGVAIIAAAMLYRHFGWAPFRQPVVRLAVDVGAPDALIRSTSLARLPRDILKLPIARDVLTEEFVYYYESHEDRLGLEGTLRRIAYEHKLEVADRLIASMLDEPATVALWRDGKGALRHFAVVMRRNTLAKVLQEAATIAMKDTQLTKAGEIGGTALYALKVNPRRTWLIASAGDRLVVLSDPGLVLDAERKVVAGAGAIVQKWLADDRALSESFALDDPPVTADHTLVLGSRALTFGYTRFVPALTGMRFDYREALWSAAMRVDPARLAKEGAIDAALWRAAPANPAACVFVPIDAQAISRMVMEATTRPAEATQQALASLEGNALACWYRDVSLYAPLIIVRTSAVGADRDALVKALAAWAIQPSNVYAVEPGYRGPKFTTNTVVTREQFILFSPEQKVVDLALDTLARKFPSAAEQMNPEVPTAAIVSPRVVAGLAEREALAALAQPGEEKLREAAQALLVPRIQALAKYPAYQVVLAPQDAGRAGWWPLDWRALSAVTKP